MNAIKIITDLANKGFIIEIVSDGWANWKFVNNKPAHDTATPLHLNLNHHDKIRSVCWRGLFWYFNKAGKLIHDDVGCLDNNDNGYERILQLLIDTYNNYSYDIDPLGFNNGSE